MHNMLYCWSAVVSEVRIIMRAICFPVIKIWHDFLFMKISFLLNMRWAQFMSLANHKLSFIYSIELDYINLFDQNKQIQFISSQFLVLWALNERHLFEHKKTS